jgi:hypothetical protein
VSRSIDEMKRNGPVLWPLRLLISLCLLLPAATLTVVVTCALDSIRKDLWRLTKATATTWHTHTNHLSAYQVFFTSQSSVFNWKWRMYLASFYFVTFPVLTKTAKVIIPLIGTRTWSWGASLYYGMYSVRISEVRLSNFIKCHPEYAFLRQICTFVHSRWTNISSYHQWCKLSAKPSLNLLAIPTIISLSFFIQ